MRILIIDDQAYQRRLLRQVLGELGPTVEITDVADPIEALQWSQTVAPDLVILDYRMPRMDGLEFARRFRRPVGNRDVPLMLVTGVGDEPLRQAALDAGITDFLLKPIIQRELASRCRNLLDVRQRAKTLQARAHALEAQLLAGATEREARERKILALLVREATAREGLSVDSVERISHIAGEIAIVAGRPAGEVDLIRSAAWLHDIGNIGVSEVLLTKPGALNDDERELVRRHTVLGYELLRESTIPYVQTGAVIALGHHERWDGGGYPTGLAGEGIPVAARIAAVADVLDALTSKRPYREAWDAEQALDYVRGQAGHQFDPELVSAITRRPESILRRLRNEMAP